MKIETTQLKVDIPTDLKDRLDEIAWRKKMTKKEYVTYVLEKSISHFEGRESP